MGQLVITVIAVAVFIGVPAFFIGVLIWASFR